MSITIRILGPADNPPWDQAQAEADKHGFHLNRSQYWSTEHSDPHSTAPSQAMYYFDATRPA